MTKIKKFDAISVGKVLGLLYGVLGLVFGAIVSLVAVIGITMSDEGSGLIGILFGVGAIVALPIFYGVLGFVAGVISSWMYNIAAKYIGGIIIETETIN